MCLICMSVHIEVRPFSLSSYLFIWLHWVLVAHTGSSLYHMRSFSYGGQALEHTGYVGFVTPLHVGSYFPDQGSNLHLLHCKEESQWLNHQESPLKYLILIASKYSSVCIHNYSLNWSHCDWYGVIFSWGCYKRCALDLFVVVCYSKYWQVLQVALHSGCIIWSCTMYKGLLSWLFDCFFP